ncbi:MAG: DinB family protein [Gemmatimonadales bacterium]|nr:DinB family protein [Gemmatimonadales bacterium]
MKTIADPNVLDDLLARLARVTPESPRQWGKMSPAEMLCHLGDAGDFVLGRRIPPGIQPSGRRRPVMKWLALRAPMRWPHGYPTRSSMDPQRDGTKPAQFEADRARVADGLRALAAATGPDLARDHMVFGPMSLADWHRWAYRHLDHHLRQFGV